ncbi:MAG: aminopeptidase P N-terminal domain-containing protein, partial [Phycisphaerales bacterium]
PEGSDQTYPFRAHSEYLYVAGFECAGAIVAFDPHDGPQSGWQSFVPLVTEAEVIWEGREQPPGTLLTDFKPWLESRRGRPVATLGARVSDVPSDDGATERIREAFTHARRSKDAHELSLLRRAASATATSYALIRDFIRPGVTERGIQIALEAEFLRHGGTRPGYGSIVGSGPNAAVLHFEPSRRMVGDGDFVLIDAGAEVDRYTVDVTRTFVAGQPSAFQRDLHQVVRRTEERAIARCVAGAEWKRLHLAAAVDLVEGLVDMGVMHGHPTALVEQEAHTLFFPHGLGHMVGLGVRDASGRAPGRARDPRASLRTLRMDLPLAPGYVVTVEPGLYFIRPLLMDPARRARFAHAVNWNLVDEHLHLGGVRIEDNVLVTDGAPEILTREIPKTLD